MNLRLYQVDAFTERLFGGNPAAVVPLEHWLPDNILQNIALENNLSETAFYVREGDVFRLRWFTPEVEVDLCGHATLATGHVLFRHEKWPKEEIFFQSRSGLLSVKKNGDFLTLDFPADVLKPVEQGSLFSVGQISPKEIYRGISDYLFVFESEEDVVKFQPDFYAIGKLDARGLIITAIGNNSDFVSRFFAPQCGINEDPVTGSAHTTLAPYWAGKLNRTTLTAVQLSKRRGYLNCTYTGERVLISGKAVTYLVGTIEI